MPVIAIQNLSLANTFGEWVNVTNDLVNTFNGIVYDDFYKPAGTMYLLEPTTGLVVSNTAVFSGQVDIASPYGSLLVRTNADIQGELTLSNTNGIDLVLSANGTANINYLNIVGTGLAANVANNMYIGGTLTVSGNTTMSSNLTVANSITANSGTITRDLDINRHANVNNNLVVGGNIEGDSMLTIYGDTYLKTSLAVTGTTYTDILQANTSANTANLNVISKITSGSISVTGNTSTGTLSVNTFANTRTLFVSQTAHVNVLKVTTGIDAPIANVTSQLNANSSAAFFGTVQTQGKLSVGGDFIINGSTVYNSNTLTLSSSSSNEINYIKSYRSPGANAAIRWYEPGKYWDILDVTTGGVYSKILTANLISDSVTSIITSNVASSFAANTLNNSIISVNTALTINTLALQGQITSNVNSLQLQITSNSISSNAIIVTANTDMKNYVDTANTKMLSYVNTANTNMKNYVDTANTNLKSYTDSTFVKGTTVGVVQTISSDVTVTGNLVVSGATVIVNSTTVETADSLIKLAKNNIVGDALDIGFYGEYNTGGNIRYAGMFRKAADKFYLIKDVIPDPSSNTFIFSSSNRATIDASLVGGTVSSLASAIAVADGGTSATTPTGALTNLLPSTGYGVNNVLATGGSGTYYWYAVANTAYVDAANTNNILYTNTQITANNTSLKSYVDLNKVASVSGTTNQVIIGGTSIAPVLSLPQSINTTAAVTFSTVNTTRALIGNGSAAAPSIAFTSDGAQDTGFYWGGDGYTNFTNNGVYSGQIQAGGNLVMVGSVTSYSDSRLKENVISVDGALDKVSQLRGVYFNKISDENKTRRLGVIAQEVQEVLPEVVLTDDEGMLSVDYGNIVGVLIEAIKELKLEIDILKSK